jgi:hypothetical protein
VRVTSLLRFAHVIARSGWFRLREGLTDQNGERQQREPAKDDGAKDCQSGHGESFRRALYLIPALLVLVVGPACSVRSFSPALSARAFVVTEAKAPVANEAYELEALEAEVPAFASVPVLPAALRITPSAAMALSRLGNYTAEGMLRATLIVDAGGGGNYTTIPACESGMSNGDTCLVNPGTYDTYNVVNPGGASGARRSFVANGAVTTRGFYIDGAYVTVEGFNLSGHTTAFQGAIQVTQNGSNCEVLDNTIANGAASVYGINLTPSAASTPANCLVRGNTLDDVDGIYFNLGGDNHIIEENEAYIGNGWDFIRLFGEGHIIRRNIFRNGIEGAGGHGDVIQTFGLGTVAVPTLKSINHLFEKNWIENLEYQLGQTQNGDGQVDGEIFSNIHTITWRQNVVVNTEYNFNSGSPNITFVNNTTYKLAYGNESGIAVTGSRIDGDITNHAYTNNVFLGNALNTPTTAGYVTFSGYVLDARALAQFVTGESHSVRPIANAIILNLCSNGYVSCNSSALILNPARALACAGDPSDMTLDPAYNAYKSGTYTYLCQAVASDTASRNSLTLNYNYVAGSVAGGYLPKQTSGCTGGGTYVLTNFCELNGINGGDPDLQDPSDPDGPDDIPFTTDDGLKPVPGSILCGAGDGGLTIGAYSCNPSLVFADEDEEPAGPIRIRRRGL